MADERSTPLNQGTNKWLQITDGGKLQTWNGVDSPAPIIGDDPLVTKTELDDKASLSGTRVNVKDYGAVGDGETDDTDAIQAAIDAINVGTVYLPEGVFLVEKIVSKANVTIQGCGWGTVIKLKDGDYGGGFFGVIEAKGTEESLLDGVVLRDFVIDGNKDNVTVTNANNTENIELNYCNNPKVINVKSINATSEGVDMDYCVNGVVALCYFENTGGYGVHISVDSSRCLTTDCFAYNCGHDNDRAGFDTFTGTYQNTITNCWAIDCNKGFDVRGTKQTITNCFAINSTKYGYLCSAEGSTLTALYEEASGGRALEVSDRSISLNGFRSFDNESPESAILLSNNDITCFGIHVVNATANAIEITGQRITLNGVKLRTPGGNGIDVDSAGPVFLYGYDAVGVVGTSIVDSEGGLFIEGLRQGTNWKQWADGTQMLWADETIDHDDVVTFEKSFVNNNYSISAYSRMSVPGFIGIQSRTSSSARFRLYDQGGSPASSQNISYTVTGRWK